MAGTAQQIIEVAQAESGDVLQDGTVMAPDAEHAVEGDAAHEAGSEDHGSSAVAHTEAAGHSDVFPPFDPAYFGGQLLWLAITFAALYIIMSRVALPRIGSIIETRKARIDGDLREAERLRQETEKAAAAYEEALAEARRNAHVIAEETRASIKADIDGRRADVEAGLAKRVAEAETRIEADKSAALVNVDSIAADAAQALVAKLLGKVTAAEAKAAVAAAKE